MCVSCCFCYISVEERIICSSICLSFTQTYDYCFIANTTTEHCFIGINQLNESWPSVRIMDVCLHWLPKIAIRDCNDWVQSDVQTIPWLPLLITLPPGDFEWQIIKLISSGKRTLTWLRFKKKKHTKANRKWTIQIEQTRR